MKINLPVAALSLSFAAVGSQALAQNDQQVFLLDQHSNPGLVLREIPPAPPQLEGSAYVNEEWQRADLFLNSGKEIRGVWVRYDVLNKLLQVRLEDMDKWFSTDYFTQMKLYEDPLHPANATLYENFRKYDKMEAGFVQTLFSDDHLTVMEYFHAEVKEPTYVATHHIGNPNRQVVQQSTYYLFTKGQLMSFKRTRKSLAEVSGKTMKEMKSLLKNESLDLARDTDLVRFFQVAM